MRRIACLTVALVSICGVLLAADFWDKKEFLEWNDKEARRMLENSPWAREVQVMLPANADFGRGPIGPAPGSGGGGGFEGPDVPGGAGSGGRGGGGLGENELARPTFPLIVQWMSALPVKQAMVRLSAKSEDQIDDRARQYLEREESHYVVSVVGVPNRMAPAEGAADTLIENARLEFGKNREPMKPEKVEMRPEQQSVSLFFLFPRTEPITLEDKNVEFVFKTDHINLKRRFKLQDMVYQDNLEL